MSDFNAGGIWVGSFKGFLNFMEMVEMVEVKIEVDKGRGN